MILFAVIDIPGGLPLLVDIQNKTGRIKAGQVTLVSGLIMIIFLFVGESILNLIGIDIASFAIAGAFIIFFLALEMILGIKLYKDDLPATASVIPIAFPLIAGSGTLTTIMSLKANYTETTVLVAIVLNLVIVFIVLKSLNLIQRLLGPAGMIAVRKFFGVILLAIAVKIFATNAHGLIK